MVTMNIVGAGLKPAPTKNKKDIRKIVVQHCRNQKTPSLSPPCEGNVIELREDVSVLDKSSKVEWFDKPNTC